MTDMDKRPQVTTPGALAEAESADVALKHIVDGFKHFRHDVFPQQEELFKKLATAQQPRAMFITCADSRIVPELITQSSPGDLFVTRNVGNVVPPYGPMNGGVSTAIEYAVMALGVHHIIVCGHSDCGAMRAVLNPDTIALTGDQVRKEDVELIFNQCLEFIPREHMPQITVLEQPDDDYMNGLISVTLESLTYQLQLVEKRR